MAKLFYKSRERKLNCQVCDAKAVSVCNYRGRNFRGCGQPFCFSHGVSQKFKDFNLVGPEQESLENKKQRMLLSTIFNSKKSEEVRCCGTCLQSTGSWFKRGFGGLLIAGYLVVVVASIIFFFSTATKQCFRDEIWDPFKVLCYKKVTVLSAKQQLGWFEFQNSFVGGSDCKTSIFNKSNLESSNINVTDDSPPEQLNIQCRCSSSSKKAIFRIIGSKVVRRTLCKASEEDLRTTCPPNGRNWISTTESCLLKAPSGLNEIIPLPSGHFGEDGNEVLCPLGTMLDLEKRLCQRTVCPHTFYHLNARTGQCQNCPLYEKKDHSSEVLCRSSKDLIKRQVFMKGRMDVFLSNLKQCPAASPHLNSSQLQEADDLGYYSLAVDPFGYKQCPVVKEEGSFQRECQPSEMLIRFIIKCKSPCLPCKEKWDFARKKCVPVKAACPALRHITLQLISTGDCLQSGEFFPSSLLPDAGEFFCSD